MAENSNGGISCDVTRLRLPGSEGQNTRALSVCTAHAHGNTIATTMTQVRLHIKTKETLDYVASVKHFLGGLTYL